MTLFALLSVTLGFSPQNIGPSSQGIGRERIESLEFPELSLELPEVAEEEIEGVPIYHLYDPTLPLVDIQLQLLGGTSHFPRERLGAVSAFPFVLRTGGTRNLSADEVDERLDLLAVQLTVGSGGGGTSIHLNSLTRTTEPALDLLREILLNPAFDPAAVEVWRGQAAERVRRREDNPSGLAFSEFNRLMYGDHPVGWVMDAADLSSDRISVQALRELQEALVCRDRLLVGVSGDLTWEQAEPLLRRFLEPWPPCTVDLTLAPEPSVRQEAGVFVLPKPVAQSMVIVAHPSPIRQGDTDEYFASRIANHLLGSGGFGSRMMSRLRTEAGLTYGASSVWTTPLRYDGLIGALTATSGETTVEATDIMLGVLREFRETPPSAVEVARAIEELTTRYVFAFDTPREIVSRSMLNRAQGLPQEWIIRYFERLGAVDPASVGAAIKDHLRPDEVTILIVGDPARFDPGVESLGPLYTLQPDGSYYAGLSPPEPDGSPRSPP